MTAAPHQTLADLAARWQCSPRTASREVARLRALMPAGWAPMVRGRTMLFNQQDIELLERAIRCRSMSAGGATGSGTRAGRSARAKPRPSWPNSAQDAVRALRRTPSRRGATQSSGATSLRVLPGGRAASP